MTSPDPGSFARPPAPWKHDVGLDAVLARWRADGATLRNTVLDRTIAAKESRTASIPEALHEDVRRALVARGVSELWSHQADAFSRAVSCQDIVVATPTASGKSLCYNLPVLDRLAREPDARALYLFPTKALSRDQEEALHGLLREAKLGHGAITYDGDTPGDARRVARERSGVLLTNPDMLHAGILPHHASWARFFSCLRYVVIDELHTYRGVFGSHLANVIRRLDRIARFHGASPTYVFASATIGNPESHASRMLGRPVSLVAESGAPAGEKHVLIYDPPIVNKELGLRASYVKTAVNLVADLVQAEVPTLVFGQSRNQVETMLKYLRDRLCGQHGLDPSIIHAYRSGYLPETRRRIEQGLRSGAIQCVVATNALELGIDVGSLDAVVCTGYAGSIASMWQRFGRAGRRQGSSLALLVPSSMPLDQYVARNPELLVGAPVEEARIDPDNVEILIQHLKCASFELPFEEGEAFGDVPHEAVADSMGYLAQQNVVVEANVGDRRAWHWSTDAYPASHVSLRSLSWDNFVVIDLDGDRTIAEMDWRATHTMLHVQAIYQHEGEQYQVERLDFENHKAYVRKVAPDYFTTAMTYTRVAITQEDDAAVVGIASAEGATKLAGGHGEVSVIEKVVGYKKIKFHTHENVGYGDVRLPEMQMHTSAYWLTFPEELVRGRTFHRSDGISLEVPRALVVDAIRGLGHAMQTVATVGLMCDPRDIGLAMGDRSAEGELPGTGEGGAGFDPTVFLYDAIPGGVGLAPRLFAERELLLRRTRTLIESCACDEGCPACIGVAGPHEPVPVEGARPAPLAGLSLKRLGLDLLAAVGAASVH